ncbi:MAG: transcriptional regulator [Microlunatus sp.]|nr:transcriptional regulator [Microlunatus sp.]MDN5804345.1 transcriptional regulator [Microlunatus sp.]
MLKSGGPRETDESTRQRVSRSILEHGPSTAAELADRLGLTPAAIRRHLDVLVAQGCLAAREQRTYGTRGRGRPAKVFALTDSGRGAFYSTYDDLAVTMLEFLADEAGEEAVERFAAARVAEMETRYARLLSEAPEGTSAAQVLAEALTSDGYVASVRPTAVGEQLCQHHCPVAHVAERFPQLCEAETEVFSRLAGGPVQRLATIAHGDGVCTTHIPDGLRPSPVPDGLRPSPVPDGLRPSHIHPDQTTHTERS